MNIIDDIHIRRLDLTLLILFERLLKQRNMSAVATEMGLTQSAVSHAVGRLRAVFDDPLFVRKGAGVEPTARALQLGPPLADALAGIRDAVRIGRAFNPGTAARRFTLAAPDTVIAQLAPAILGALAQDAPRCQIMFRSLSQDRAAAAVAAQEIDLAVGIFFDPPPETVGRVIAHERFRVVARRDHPRIGATLDLDTFCALDHMLLSQDWDRRGEVDRILAGLGRRRRIVAMMPQMLLAFAAASRADAIITAPLSAGLYAASLFPLTLHTPPIEVPGIDLTLLTHRDGQGDPAVGWLADLVVGAIPAERALHQEEED